VDVSQSTVILKQRPSRVLPPTIFAPMVQAIRFSKITSALQILLLRNWVFSRYVLVILMPALFSYHPN
jgi:hypothetical protein